MDKLRTTSLALALAALPLIAACNRPDAGGADAKPEANAQAAAGKPDGFIATAIHTAASAQAGTRRVSLSLLG